MQLVPDSYHLPTFIRPIHYQGDGGRNSSHCLSFRAHQNYQLSTQGPNKNGIKYKEKISYSSKLSLFLLCSCPLYLHTAKRYSTGTKKLLILIKGSLFPHFLAKRIRPPALFLSLSPSPCKPFLQGHSENHKERLWKWPRRPLTESFVI